VHHHGFASLPPAVVVAIVGLIVLAVMLVAAGH